MSFESESQIRNLISFYKKKDDNDETCIQFSHYKRYYQAAARAVIESNTGQRVLTRMIVNWSCNTKSCINPNHLIVYEPRSYNYDPTICIYCGMPADSVDHLLPNGFTTKGQRKYVPVVPSCRQCNGILGDLLLDTIAARRAHIKKRLKAKYWKKLQKPDFTKQEMSEMNHVLKSAIKAGIAEAELLRYRLNFPEDPNFDNRALLIDGEI